jgi:hypothetical protein
MSRIAIELWERRLEAAYRTDPFHAVRRNLESVRSEEWDVRPAAWNVDVFGTQPELSICDIALHVGGPKFMYAARLAGNNDLDWQDIQPPPTLDMDSVLAWIDEAHRTLEAALAAIEDDAELAAERLAPWRRPLRVEDLLSIIVNHDVYHSGEINRQRALIRGAEGWDREPAS